MRIKIILALSSLFLFYQSIYCQSVNPDTSSYNNNENVFDESNATGDSVVYYNPSYYSIKIDAGYSVKDNLILPYFTKQEYLNISYSISNFVFPLEIYPTQVGLFNELGIYNTSVYLNIGPEARIERQFYFIPYLGVSLIPFSKYDNQMVFIYYAGISTGCFISLDDQTNLIIEGGTDLIKFKQDQNNFYLKIGIGFNLYYPL
ncbi:MAG: hypothetical protein M1480_02625 [Bacteroidetes bacterium]|nr:hypothetical protein [Bacteroidota bacterium]